MDFRFKDVEKAFLAYLLSGLGSLEDRARLVAQCARFRGHDSVVVQVEITRSTGKKYYGRLAGVAKVIGIT